MPKETKISTTTIDDGEVGKHFISVFNICEKNFYASTCFTLDAGYESMVFISKQEPPANADDIDSKLVSNWKELDARHYHQQPTMTEHLQFITDFINKEGKN